MSIVGISPSIPAGTLALVSGYFVGRHKILFLDEPSAADSYQADQAGSEKQKGAWFGYRSWINMYKRLNKIHIVTYICKNRAANQFKLIYNNISMFIFNASVYAAKP
jgi:hypothetical protein